MTEQPTLDKVMEELALIKSLLSKLTGTSELPQTERFSLEAVDKAAIDFQTMSISRGEWVEDNLINKYIKSAKYYGTGNFIREHFGFSNYFKRGRSYYYNKTDLTALSKELKERNVDLGRYMDYVESQANFKKSVGEALLNTKEKKGKKNFKLPSDAKDMTSKPAPLPSAEIIRNDIKALKEEFFEHNLAEYIDIYGSNHAMLKFVYHFEKYIKPELKRRCTKWVANFNYANHALELVTKKREVFVPVKEDDMIQL